MPYRTFFPKNPQTRIPAANRNLASEKRASTIKKSSLRINSSAKFKIIFSDKKNNLPLLKPHKTAFCRRNIFLAD